MADIQFEFVDDTAPGLYEGPTLFKRDSKGKTRTWLMQITGEGHYRTLAGLKDGKQATSGWTIPVPASKDTVKDQGEFEVRSQYKHQLDREYRLTEAELDSVGAAFFEPMLAKTYATFPGPGTFDPKFDGIRCIAKAEGLFSRQGQPILAVPHIHAALGPFFARLPEAILDGELYNHDLREDFGAISSIVRKQKPTVEQLEKAEAVMQYHVYDMPTHLGSRGERKAAMADYLLLSNVRSGWIIPVLGERIETEEGLKEAYALAVGLGYEGGIYAPDGYEYEVGRRSKGLLKMKDFITEEFRVLRIEEGKGNWAGAAKRMALENNNGNADEFGAGIRGSYPTLQKMLEVEVTTESVATVRYFMRSPDGVPRFPVVIDFHPNGRKD